MKAEVEVCEMTPAKALSARESVVPVDSRLSGAMKIIFKTMHGIHSASRQEILRAAKKKGYTEAEVEAALDYLVKTPVLTESVSQIVSTPSGPPTPGSSSGLGTFDPYAAGERLVEELKATEGGAWTGQELQKRFKLTPATLHRRRKEHRIIYFRDGRHDFHYPIWQFTPGGAMLPGIQEVLAKFQSRDEWRVMRYFLGKRAELGDRRPLDLLRDGEREKVLAHAKIHAEENTW